MASQPVNIAKPSSNGQNAYRRGNKSRSHSLSSFSPSSYDINQYANGAGQEKFDLASEKPKDILARISPFDLEDVGERVEYINPEVKNILITGGAGFMWVQIPFSINLLTFKVAHSSYGNSSFCTPNSTSL